MPGIGYPSAMEPLDSWNRWSDRLRDRARAATFFRFLWRRFLDDRLFEAAGALAFTTLFALVPLSMVVFGALSVLSAFDAWTDQLRAYIFSNFVPSSAQAVEQYLLDLQQDPSKLTAAGAIALVASVLITLNSVETTFNRIWRVPTARPKLGRFLVYWTVLTLGALVAASSLALSTRFFALAIFETAPGRLLEALMLRAAPMIIELACFALIFKVVPHRTIKWRHAVAGAVLSVLLFELVKQGIGYYFGRFGNYQAIYGPLAVVPIMMLWIFLGWVAVLLGASFASSMSGFRYQPVAMRLPQGYEMYGLLRLLGRFNEARRTGKGLHTDDIQQLEPLLTDALLQEMLGQLARIDLVSRAESGEWLLSRDLDQVGLAELYEACHLRVPINEAHLPCRDDTLGVAAANALDELRVPLRALLKHRVSNVFAPSRREDR